MKRSTASIKSWAQTISFLILTLLYVPCLSQSVERVYATGSSVSRDLTPKQAEDEALEEAKKNALLKAGIPQNLLVSNVLFEFGDERQMESYFHGISSSELNAHILVDSLHQRSYRFDSDGNMLVSVEIEASVYKYSKPKDPSFFFEVDGLREVYEDREFIRFTFTPSKAGYLKIFAFNEDESFVLYPYEHEEYDYLSDAKARLFVGQEPVDFPIHEAYELGYSVEMKGHAKQEASLLLFVYTKDHIPWIDPEVSLESVRSWLYKIPLDEREILYRNVILIADHDQETETN